jgi:hypothetical protein
MFVLASVGGTLAAVGVTLAVLARHVEPFLRAQIVAGLEARFHTRVELDSFHVQVREGQEARFGIWAEGKGLRIWPPQKTGGDHAIETAVNSVPLIQLDDFTFHVPVKYRQTQTLLRIAEVRLTGLKIDVPPKREMEKRTGLESAMGRPAAPPGNAGAAGMLENVVVERVVCQHVELVLETDKPEKLPLTFEIEKMTLKHLTAGRPMDFEAVLTNARPTGLIRTEGSFGPWMMQDPGESAVNGKYTFENANLGDFNGIAGTLSSTGNYDGTLREMAVTGSANVPDFALTKYGTAMELDTNFRARVDGTDGDTYLDEVDARLGKSQFRLQGKVVRVRMDASGKEIPASALSTEATAETGRLIDLKVDVPAVRAEDFLRLVNKSGTPLMTGDLTTRAALQIPPGKQPVPERLKLDGQFKLYNARFTNEKFQGRVEDLSLRGQGKPGALKNTDPGSIAAEMQGGFHMAGGVITLPDLDYRVPGADIALQGTYGLDGALHFDGTARMVATVSQMVGGWKGMLLKPADRFFKKDGAGTQVPIRVRGTREAPDFGVDLGRMGSTHPAKPQ